MRTHTVVRAGEPFLPCRTVGTEGFERLDRGNNGSWTGVGLWYINYTAVDPT